MPALDVPSDTLLDASLQSITSQPRQQRQQRKPHAQASRNNKLPQVNPVIKNNGTDTNAATNSIAVVDDIQSRKYGHLPRVVRGRVVGEDISRFKKEDIDPTRMKDILQGKITIQPMDYCKTVPIKIALERDENGESTHLTQKDMLLSMSLLRFYKNFRNLYVFTKLINGDSAISLRLIEYFVVNYVVDHNTVYNVLHYQSNPSYLIQHLNKPTPTRKSTANNAANTTDNVDNNTVGCNGNNEEDKMTADPAEIQADIQKHSQLQEKRLLVGEELDIMMDFDNYVLVHDRYKAQLKEHSKLSFDPFCRSTRVCRGTNTTRNTRICLVLPEGVTLSTTIAQMNFFKWAIQDHVLEYILDNQSAIDQAMADYETRKSITTLPLDDDLEHNSSEVDSDAVDMVATASKMPEELNLDTDIDSTGVEITPVHTPTQTHTKHASTMAATTTESDNSDEVSKSATATATATTTGVKSSIGGVNRTKKAASGQPGKRRRRGRDNNHTVTRYTCRRVITFD